tara:strand:+ start:1031 stop:1588 length:558 start_codon:yes stop_codon:yes gene_type:complete
LSGIKTFSNETSERYALALLELANENSEVEDIEKNVFFLLKIFKENSDFQNFLKNPTYQLEVQIKVFKEILKVIKLNKILENFLQFIIKKRRIYFLDKILETFIKLNSKRKGIVKAVLVSSKDLSQAEKNRINQEISKSINSIVDFNYKIDKSLISGVKVQLGSLLIDTSVSNKLKNLKQLMIEN